ncbi:MAG: zf-HC2 domain-containing protein [Verrucomicrobia bacterium]|nr:zf-HC2 domain-containing protein [Verrucomicrobiota bacterium]
MKCDEIQDVLFDYMTRELGGARSELVREHIHRCPACQKAAADIQATLDLLHGAAGEDTGMSDHLSAESRDQMTHAIMHPVRHWIYSHHILISAIIAAIALIITLLALRNVQIIKRQTPVVGPVFTIGAGDPGDLPETGND